MKATEKVATLVERETNRHDKVMKNLNQALLLARSLEKKVPDLKVVIGKDGETQIFSSSGVKIEKMSFWESEYEGDRLVKANFWTIIDGTKVFRKNFFGGTDFILAAEYWFGKGHAWKEELKKSNIPEELINRASVNVARFNQLLREEVKYDHD